MQQKWLAKLMGFDYEIVYKKGKENPVADALSRVSNKGEGGTTGKLHLISVAQNGWVAEVMQSYVSDDQVQQVITGIAAKDDNFAHYQFLN